jgi:hypothetical protein
MPEPSKQELEGWWDDWISSRNKKNKNNNYLVFNKLKEEQQKFVKELWEILSSSMTNEEQQQAQIEEIKKVIFGE